MILDRASALCAGWGIVLDPVPSTALSGAHIESQHSQGGAEGWKLLAILAGYPQQM